MEYSFNVFNKLASDGLTVATEKLLSALIKADKSTLSPAPPVVGSMLQHTTQGLGPFVYGTLKNPVTAKEIRYLRSFLKATYKNRAVIAVDAAVGNEGDIGLVKVSDTPLMPGAGANKKLGAIGQLSIMGVVAEKSLGNYGLFNTTRLNLVYTMAEIISDALSSLLWEKTNGYIQEIQ
ncbi:MAG: spore protease YyaC [Clostridia bacterium]|nr:spore protease YyaC [Clostridia bacterium]